MGAAPGLTCCTVTGGTVVVLGGCSKSPKEKPLLSSEEDNTRSIPCVWPLQPTPIPLPGAAGAVPDVLGPAAVLSAALA